MRVFIVFLAFVSVSPRAQEVFLQTIPSGTLSCAPISLTNLSLGQLIGERIPLVKTDGLPKTCQVKVSELLGTWIKQDTQNQNYLRNKKCAALSGWAENHEGECQAGGPPPICVANHWHHDFSALDIYRQLVSSEFVKRQNELKAATCSCMTDEISAALAQPEYSPERPRGTSSWLQVCKSSADCAALPGSMCSNGGCQFPSKVAAPIAQAAASKFADKALEHFITAAPLMSQALQTVYKDVTPIVTGITDAKRISDGYDGWRAALNELSSNYSQLQALRNDIVSADNIASTGQLPLHGRAYYRASLMDLQKRFSGVAERAIANLRTMNIEGSGPAAYSTCPGLADTIESRLRSNAQSFSNLGLSNLVDITNLPERGAGDSVGH
jgi:hypothetical protein